MLIESDRLEKYLKAKISEYTIHFHIGDYIMRDGAPYAEIYDILKGCMEDAEYGADKNENENTS